MPFSTPLCNPHPLSHPTDHCSSDCRIKTVERGTHPNTVPGARSTHKTAMIFDELAQSPFIQNGGPLLIFLIIVVWFLAKEPLDKLWEWIKRRLSPPDR